MNTRPSTPVTREMPVPVSNRRRVRVFFIGGLIGLGLGLIGGVIAGFIVLLIGNSSIAPSFGLELIALFLWPLIAFPIAGLCTGLVMATQRNAERGSVVGVVIFGGSQLVLSIPSITELWILVAPLVVVAAVIGALIGVICVAMSAAVSRGSSAHSNVTLEAGKWISPVSAIMLSSHVIWCLSAILRNQIMLRTVRANRQDRQVICCHWAGRPDA